MTVGELLWECHRTVKFEVEQTIYHINGEDTVTTVRKGYAGADDTIKDRRYKNEDIDSIEVRDNVLVICISKVVEDEDEEERG